MKKVFAILLCGIEVMVVGTQSKADVRAARSVHLWYSGDPATVFYNEVKVLQSQNGSYFMTCGFDHGYCGIQQLENPHSKVVIFSVWDPGKQNNSSQTPAAERVQVLYHDPSVIVKRFGGEGTGEQSFYHYDWKVGHTYRLAIQAQPMGDRTAYTAFCYLNGRKKWLKLATFSTITGGELLKGFYSFIEDFRRDGQSAHQTRKAIYMNGYICNPKGRWTELTRATFTADSTPTTNIDAEVVGSGFLLATGGNVVEHTPLYSKLTRQPTGMVGPIPSMVPISK